MIVVGGESLVDLVDEAGLLHPVPGGGPFNTAIALGRLDVGAAYLGTLSRDRYGRLLAGLLVDAGVDMSLVRFSDDPTPLAVVDRSDDGTNRFTFYLSGTAFVDLPADALPEVPAEAVAIHVGTLALALDPPLAAYEELVRREAGRRAIVVDPNIRPGVFGDAAAYRDRFERLAAAATVVKLSGDDATWIYPGAEAEDVAERLLRLGPRVVAITLGSDGAIAAAGDVRVRVPAVAVDVADTVGAGDSFGAAFMACLCEQQALQLVGARPLEEATLERAVAFAVAAAAVTCTRVGAVPPTRVEVDACMLATDTL